MTLTEARIRVNNNTGSDVEDSVIDVALRHAQKLVALMLPFSELEQKLDFSLIGGQSTYSIEGDLGIADMRNRMFYSIHYLKTSDAPKVRYLTPVAWDTIVLPHRNLVGYPFYYTMWGGNIEIWKVPDATYSLQFRYYNWPTFPASVGASFIPGNVDECIEAYATSIIFMSLEEEKTSGYWFTLGNKFMKVNFGDKVKLLNFEQTQKSLASSNSTNYWADPFSNRMP